jgi:ankyrin repeat protein
MKTKEQLIDDLFTGAITGNLELVKKSLDAGINPDTKNEGGITPLMITINQGHDKLVKILLERGADIHQENSEGISPIYIAAQIGYLKIFQDLDAATLFRKTNKNYPTLCVAADSGRTDVVEELLNKGVDINSKGTDGRSALFCAAEIGNCAMAKLLLERGVDANKADNEKNITPLLIATQYGYYDMVEVLLEHNAKTNLSDINGITPLYIAAQNGNYRLAELLLGKGAEIDSPNKRGATPLYIAAQNGFFKIVELLLDQGAKIELANNEGVTPFLAAIAMGKADVLKVLLNKILGIENQEREVKLTIKDIVNRPLTVQNQIFTPLQLAFYFNNEASIKYLLEIGADPLLKDEFGVAPIDLITEEKSLEIVKNHQAFEEFKKKVEEKIKFAEDILESMPKPKPSQKTSRSRVTDQPDQKIDRNKIQVIMDDKAIILTYTQRSSKGAGKEVKFEIQLNALNLKNTDSELQKFIIEKVIGNIPNFNNASYKAAVTKRSTASNPQSIPKDKQEQSTKPPLSIKDKISAIESKIATLRPQGSEHITQTSSDLIGNIVGILKSFGQDGLATNLSDDQDITKGNFPKLFFIFRAKLINELRKENGDLLGACSDTKKTNVVLKTKEEIAQKQDSLNNLVTSIQTLCINKFAEIQTDATYEQLNAMEKFLSIPPLQLKSKEVAEKASTKSPVKDKKTHQEINPRVQIGEEAIDLDHKRKIIHDGVEYFLYCPDDILDEANEETKASFIAELEKCGSFARSEGDNGVKLIDYPVYEIKINGNQRILGVLTKQDQEGKNINVINFSEYCDKAHGAD